MKNINKDRINNIYATKKYKKYDFYKLLNIQIYREYNYIFTDLKKADDFIKNNNMINTIVIKYNYVSLINQDLINPKKHNNLRI
jgi:hypothetical protein